MGTIIRITGDGVFIESNLKISSMETCSSNVLNYKMCNLPSDVNDAVDEINIQQHAIMCDSTDFVEHQMTRTKSYEVNNIRGQCLTVGQCIS